MNNRKDDAPWSMALQCFTTTIARRMMEKGLDPCKNEDSTKYLKMIDKSIQRYEIIEKVIKGD